MRFTEFDIFEDSSVPTLDELEGMKAVIAGKIKELPDDDATARALKEIEELLSHVNSGGRMGMIYDQLETVNDPSVLAAQKMLARYILSIDSTPEERTEFFTLWRADRIVNIAKLLDKKKHSFGEIFNGYEKNNLIKEFVDDVMDISALGQGRGEFGLNVLSKSIWKPEDGKGDLRMRLKGKELQIECKTTAGGAARFSDQQVRPAEGYEKAAVALNDFVRKNKTNPMKVPEYGVNVNAAIAFAQGVDNKDRATFLGLVQKVVSLIFGGKSANTKDVSAIVNAIKAGDSGAALQAWSQASFNYYMSFKDDDGVLAIDLNNKDFVFYDTAEDLTKEGLRFHASTPYLSTVKDPGRGVYPQLEVIPTTFGGQAALKSIPKVNKKHEEHALMQSIEEWCKSFGLRRGVTDLRTLKGMTKAVIPLIQQKMPSDQIMMELERMFPALQPPRAVPYTQLAQPKKKAPAPVAPKPQGAQPAQPAQPARAPTV